MNGSKNAAVYLDDETFSLVIKSAPLISIDLIIRNQAGDILLGLRNNRPAEGFWFVPGGRIFKDESIASAFKRIAQAELGLTLNIDKAKYLGLYEHFYVDSIFTEKQSNKKIKTHYVVSAFLIVLVEANSSHLLDILPIDQHCSYKWMSKADLMASKSVHEHTKWYFNVNKGFR